MKKLLFLDYRGLALVRGFTRILEKPSKHPSNPVMRPEHPWEGVSLTLYGSVVKAPDRPYQLWYTMILPPWRFYVGYAESEDGLSWRKPLLDLFPLEWGKTNIVLDGPARRRSHLRRAREP